MSRFFQATIRWKGLEETFRVGSPHGKRWAETRAISCFLYSHPDLNMVKEVSFKEAARLLKKDGLKITLLEE